MGWTGQGEGGVAPVHFRVFFKDQVLEFLRQHQLPESGAAAVVKAVSDFLSRAPLSDKHIVVSRDGYKSFITVPGGNGDKLRLCVFFELDNQGRRVVTEMDPFHSTVERGTTQGGAQGG